MLLPGVRTADYVIHEHKASESFEFLPRGNSFFKLKDITLNWWSPHGQIKAFLSSGIWNHLHLPISTVQLYSWEHFGSSKDLSVHWLVRIGQTVCALAVVFAFQTETWFSILFEIITMKRVEYKTVSSNHFSKALLTLFALVERVIHFSVSLAYQWLDLVFVQNWTPSRKNLDVLFPNMWQRGALPRLPIMLGHGWDNHGY